MYDTSFRPCDRVFVDRILSPLPRMYPFISSFQLDPYTGSKSEKNETKKRGKRRPRKMAVGRRKK